MIRLTEHVFPEIFNSIDDMTEWAGKVMIISKKDAARTGLIKGFLKVFIPFFVLFFGGFISIHILDHHNKTKIKLVEEGHHIKLLKNAITNDLEHVLHDVLVLADSEALQNYLKNKTAGNYRKAADRFATFAMDRMTYDQIRFLDERGMETVRVNRASNKNLFAPTDALQDKSNRYYFTQSIGLNKHDLYISPLDLNMEHGEIERPHKPMVRIATPVFDENNTKRGVLILNYLAQKLLNHFFEQIPTSELHEYSLVNADGFWLHGAEDSLNFGFMFGQKETFATRYPIAWKTIQNDDVGQFFTPEGAFTFFTVNPNSARLPHMASLKPDLSPASSKVSWKIISFQPQAEIKFNIFSQEHLFHWMLFCGLIIFTALAALWAAKEIHNKKEIERNLVLSKEDAEKANRAKSEFLAAMSHDLRTPLNAIMGFSDMMRQKAFGPLGNQHYEDYADDIYNSGSLLVSLINDVLDLSKIEAGKYELTNAPLSVSGIAEDCIRQLSSLANISNLTLVSNVSPELPQIVGDERVIIQILNNLLSNAIKFTPAGGLITITADLNDDHSMTVSVQDTGVGMASEGITKALRPFEQADATLSQEHEGTGLGLHLCVNFMKLFGGTLEIDSEVGKGTTVVITFPPERTILLSA